MIHPLTNHHILEWKHSKHCECCPKCPMSLWMLGLLQSVDRNVNSVWKGTESGLRQNSISLLHSMQCILVLHHLKGLLEQIWIKIATIQKGMTAFAIGLLFVFSFFKILTLSTVLIHHTYIPTECEYEHWRFIEFELLLAEHTVHRPQSKYGWWSI